MTEKQIGGNGMAKRQPTVLRVPENGAGDPFFGRQGNWFEVIFESSYDGFYITDGNAITLTLNKSYETISGLRKEEMVGRSMAELVASRVISGSGTLLALERRESVTMEQQFKTGKRAIITSTPVFDSESNIVMVVTNVRDVTELYSPEGAAGAERGAQPALFRRAGGCPQPPGPQSIQPYFPR